MKYFAMIGGQQYGPMELEDMPREGVRPDTYVWCKGMQDWQPASDVADICRYFRLRLAGELPSQKLPAGMQADAMTAAEALEQEELLRRLPPMAQRIVRESGLKLSKENFPEQLPSKVPILLPVALIFLSVLMLVIGILLL